MVATAPNPLSLRVLAPSFRRHLSSLNRSPGTVRCYLAAVTGLTTFLERNRLPTAAPAIEREHLEAYFATRLGEVKPSSVLVTYRALNVFWQWVTSEGEVEDSPMARMHPPSVQFDPPAVLADVEVVRLLAACEGRAFADRRDMAIIRLLLDTGMRRAELTGLKVSGVDLQVATALVLELTRFRGRWTIRQRWSCRDGTSSRSRRVTGSPGPSAVGAGRRRSRCSRRPRGGRRLGSGSWSGR